MSEPDCGSDLAAVRTRATAVDGGFRVNGAKVWITYAHEAHYMILFCRTSGKQEDRQRGTSQLLVDLKTPGIKIRPIIDLAGEHHFNEVAFEDVFLPASALIGRLGDGWLQVTNELAFERSGPDRFLSSFTLLAELITALGQDPSEEAARAIGRLTAHLISCCAGCRARWRPCCSEAMTPSYRRRWSRTWEHCSSKRFPILPGG